MAAHLLSDLEVVASRRARVTGFNYCGAHRRWSCMQVGVPGTLVMEPGADVPSSVIRQIDERLALVRHVGTSDDHPAELHDLRPFSDGRRVRVGADHGTSR